MTKPSTAALLACLAFALSACGREPAPADRQSQTATAYPAPAETQPPVKQKSRRDDGPVYTGQTY